MLSAIVCMDNFGGIGKDGDLLYKIPEDTQRFRELTMGHWVIMGRKTWNSIGNKPLPGRTNIIISNTLNFSMLKRISIIVNLRQVLIFGKILRKKK